MLTWQNLAPHRPLKEGDRSYVERPGNDGGERLARLVAATTQPMIITGPVGVGKSTELGHVVDYLTRKLKRPGVLVKADRNLNMIRAKTSAVLEAVTTAPVFDELDISQHSTEDKLRIILRSDPQRKILIDGLEKCSDDIARQVVQTLCELDSNGQIVIAVAYPTAKGKGHRDILVTGASVQTIHAVYMDARQPLTTSNWKQLKEQPSYQFFYAMAEQRLGPLSALPETFQFHVLRAAQFSGGIPRVFLQILLDAATHAQLAMQTLPREEDFDDAVRAQENTLRNQLRKGDLDALKKSSKGGRDWDLEIPFERRLRLLTEGLLLEYNTWEVPAARVAVPAPLLYRFLAQETA